MAFTECERSGYHGHDRKRLVRWHKPEWRRATVRRKPESAYSALLAARPPAARRRPSRWRYAGGSTALLLVRKSISDTLSSVYARAPSWRLSRDRALSCTCEMVGRPSHLVPWGCPAGSGTTDSMCWTLPWILASSVSSPTRPAPPKQHTPCCADCWWVVGLFVPARWSLPPLFVVVVRGIAAARRRSLDARRWCPRCPCRFGVLLRSTYSRCARSTLRALSTSSGWCGGLG